MLQLKLARLKTLPRRGQSAQGKGMSWLMRSGVVTRMKKKLLECAVHGLSLFRCKKRCWKGGSKDKPYSCVYSEDCFKCVWEGRLQQGGNAPRKRKKHITVRVE